MNQQQQIPEWVQQLSMQFRRAAENRGGYYWTVCTTDAKSASPDTVNHTQNDPKLSENALINYIHLNRPFAKVFVIRVKKSPHDKHPEKFMIAGEKDQPKVMPQNPMYGGYAFGPNGQQQPGTAQMAGANRMMAMGNGMDFQLWQMLMQTKEQNATLLQKLDAQHKEFYAVREKDQLMERISSLEFALANPEKSSSFVSMLLEPVKDLGIDVNSLLHAIMAKNAPQGQQAYSQTQYTGTPPGTGQTTASMNGDPNSKTDNEVQEVEEVEEVEDNMIPKEMAMKMMGFSIAALKEIGEVEPEVTFMGLVSLYIEKKNDPMVGAMLNSFLEQHKAKVRSKLFTVKN